MWRGGTYFFIFSMKKFGFLGNNKEEGVVEKGQDRCPVWWRSRDER